MIYIPVSKTLKGHLAQLKLKKVRDEKGLFVAEGSKCVCDTLAHFKLTYLVATENWISRHPTINVDAIYVATETDMKRISSLSTPPEVLAVYEKPTPQLNEKFIQEDLTLVLDDVQDPGNLGTIIRLADWFGIKQVVASEKSADIFNPKAVQATMGSISRVNVFYRNLPEFINSYTGIPVVGLMLDGENIYTKELPENALIIMGNEGRGLSLKVRELVDMKLLIPSFPPGAVTGESLNVAMATAITLSEFRRRLY